MFFTTILCIFNILIQSRIFFCKEPRARVKKSNFGLVVYDLKVFKVSMIWLLVHHHPHTHLSFKYQLILNLYNNTHCPRFVFYIDRNTPNSILASECEIKNVTLCRSKELKTCNRFDLKSGVRSIMIKKKKKKRWYFLNNCNERSVFVSFVKRTTPLPIQLRRKHSDRHGHLVVVGAGRGGPAQRNGCWASCVEAVEWRWWWSFLPPPSSPLLLPSDFR